ncbi:MAG: ABC transporter permease [Pseudomonadota bacterium]|nr:ABC transporter permease [Pseudomonadota bacterium]
MRFSRFLAIFQARNKEFWRDRAALGWNIVLPALVVLVFAFGFVGDGGSIYKVGVLEAGDRVERPGFLETRYIRFVPVTDRTGAITRVERHQLDMLVDPDDRRYWVNGDSAKGYLLERILNGSPEGNWTREAVAGGEIRYVDWLIPGVLGMNIMFSALWGVGYVIVRYRKNGVLKRLQATPLTAFEFLAAQVSSRLWVILGVTLLVYVGTYVFVDFKMYGSYLALFVLFALGAVSLISLGLVVAARVASEELADGILNLTSWPMMFLSGVWFSMEGLHPIVRGAAQVFPLTHMIDGARAVMLDGAGFLDVWPQMLTLVLMTTVCMAIGSLTFRWE